MQAGALHKLLIGDGRSSAGVLAIFMPMYPGLTGGSVVDNLVQISRDCHLMLANGLWLGAIHWPSKNINITLGTFDVFAGVLFDFTPGASIMTGILWHDIGQTKALRHRLLIMHIACGRHMSAVKARATIIR